MSYITIMFAVTLTFINVSLAFFVVWLISELLPDIIKKWRGY